MAWTDYLPSWATVEMRKDRLGNDEMWIAVDSLVAYPKMLEKMAEAVPALGGEITQEKLTLARYMVTRYLKKIMYDNGGEPPVRLHIVDTDKMWALGDYPKSGMDINSKKAAVYRACGIYHIRTASKISLD